VAVVLAAATSLLPTAASQAAPAAPAPAAASVGHQVQEPVPAGSDGLAPPALPLAVAKAELAANPVRCEGDGVAGKRLEVLYVREAGQPNRLAEYTPTFRTWLAGADDAYNDSAAKTGGSRHLRFVTDTIAGGCQIRVSGVQIPDGTFVQGWQKIWAEVQLAGWNRVDRKYVMFDENKPICGGAAPDNDETPGPTSRWNSGPAWVEIGPDCWGSNAAAHEIGHALGAVRDSAPHADGTAHCREEWDLMCYGSAVNAFPCGEKDDDRLLDCGNDDYFHTNPAAGSYLATHWNVANNEFLIKGSVPDNDDGHIRGGKSFVITNASTGQAMQPVDAAGSPLLREIGQAPRSGAAQQRWVINYDTGWQIVNAASQLCLDSSYSQTAPGTQTLQYRCEQSNGMRWALQPTIGGRFAIINYLSGLALTGVQPGDTLQRQQPYTGALDQQWNLEPTAEVAPAAGSTYTLTSRYAKNLQVTDSVSGTNASYGDLTGALNQQWRLQAGSAAGRFKVVNRSSNLCLRPETSTATAGVKVEQFTCTTNANQEWTIRRYADTRYGLINRTTGLAIAMVNEDAGTGITQEPYQGGEGRLGGQVAGTQVNRVWGFTKIA
jgi:hypothetical protein